MKKYQIKITAVLGLLLIWACSTKKDRFVNRNFHSLTTKYNVLYHGNIALNKGINEVKATYQDDFWEVLPPERMQKTLEEIKPGETKNTNFERAETKATKAIQVHSMNIDGFEKNTQTDEAYIALGKARYYDNRFLPALEAFNYVLYKYPNSNNVYQAQVWREKVNLRLDNEDIAIDGLKKTLETKKNIKSQDLADINAVLAQAYIKKNSLDSAIAPIKVAKNKTKKKEERARYAFILGQLYESQKHLDSAYTAYDEVIKLKRKAPRIYTAHAKLRQNANFDFINGDTITFHKELDKLIKDIEFKKHHSELYYQKGVFYQKKNNAKEAIKYYNKSLRSPTNDRYLIFNNHRNIADIYYKKQDFFITKKYLDSALTVLDVRHKKHKAEKKYSETIDKVVEQLMVLNTTDSIVKLYYMSKPEREKVFTEYIRILKKKDSIANLVVASQNIQADMKVPNPTGGKGSLMPPSMMGDDELGTGPGIKTPLSNKPKTPDVQANIKTKPNLVKNESANIGFGTPSNFYFYNQAAITNGKKMFENKFGSIQLQDNWKWNLKTTNSIVADNQNENLLDQNVVENNTKKEYTVSYYMDQIPTDKKAVDSLNVEANYARFHLGEIFKENLKENELAKKYFGDILVNNPIAKIILPTYYNLYQLNVNTETANLYKEKIISEYPESAYAEVLKSGSTSKNISSDNEYKVVYKKVANENYREALTELEMCVKKYDGDQNNAKFEFLLARVHARIFGLEKYKEDLKKIVKAYPKKEEALKAKAILENDIPNLEKLDFGKTSKSFNLVYVFDTSKKKEMNDLVSKLNKYVQESGNVDLKVSNDLYDLQTNFVVLHGLITNETAQAVIDYLKINKNFAIKNQATIVGNEDYKVIQFKKNWNNFIIK